STERGIPSNGILVPAIILMIFYFSEFASKLLIYNDFEFNRVSGIIKFAVEILLIYFVCRYKRRNAKEMILIAAILTVIFSLGQLFLKTDNLVDRYVQNIYTLNGYLFIFILFYALKPEKEEQK